jgi:predicted TIM-barrel fold metal-dependent hydrolase
MNFMHPGAHDPANKEFDTRTFLRNATRQSDKRRYDDFLIVDVDSHHYEMDAFSEIADYMEDPVMRHMAKHTKGSFTMRTTGGYQEMQGRIYTSTGRKKEKVPPDRHRDITLATRWMDAMGVDVACLFPTPMLGLGTHPQIEVEVELSRAYNRWLCERVLAEEPRITSALYLPMNDPDAALKTIKEFGGKPGVIGFMVTTVRYKPLYDNAYMKVYAELEERGLPLSFHSATNWSDQSMALTNRFIATHALGFTWFNMLHLTNWIVNGLPERFPKLKVIWIESGLAWIPFLMQRLDNEYMMRSSEVPSLKKLPSDYMREMYYSCQPMETVNNREALELNFKMTNAETQMLYASDYPHWDMDLPSTIYDLPFLSEQAKRNILGGNAKKLFNLKHGLSQPKLDRQKARLAEAVR